MGPRLNRATSGCSNERLLSPSTAITTPEREAGTCAAEVFRYTGVPFTEYSDKEVLNADSTWADVA